MIATITLYIIHCRFCYVSSRYTLLKIVQGLNLFPCLSGKDQDEKEWRESSLHEVLLNVAYHNFLHVWDAINPVGLISMAMLFSKFEQPVLSPLGAMSYDKLYMGSVKLFEIMARMMITQIKNNIVIVLFQ